MIDNPIQIRGIEEFQTRTQTKHHWSIFIKVDAGNGSVCLSLLDVWRRLNTHGLYPCSRAGQVPGTPAMTALLEAALTSPAVAIYGFYCHAGNAYASKSLDEGSTFLTEEVTAVNGVAAEAKDIASRLGKTHNVPWVLSVGSTPTAHAAASDEVRQKLKEVLNGKIELHAGELAA